MRKKEGKTIIDNDLKINKKIIFNIRKQKKLHLGKFLLMGIK